MRAPFLERISRFAPLLLRVGLAAVILWFGTNQLLEPSLWVSWVPAWTSALGTDAMTVVYLNGAFEVVAGVLLLLGCWTRLVAFAIFLHMCLIILDIGMSPTGVRDAGIAVGLLALAMQEGDRYSLTRDPLAHRSL